MKISKWYNNRDIRIEEVARPEPGQNEMLVKVKSCGICGSDVVEWYRLPRAPLVQGHEIGAEVVQVGDAVTRFRPGDRVFVAPKVPCMKCHWCENEQYPVCPNVKERLPGGFAQYVLVPKALVEHGAYHLPDKITLDQSTFIEPLACVVRAQRLAGVRKGRTILVMGSGMSGLLHVKLAKAKGARIGVTDVNPDRLEIAKRCGADLALDATEPVPDRLEIELGKKPDVVVLCTAAMAAVDQAWKSVDKGGVVVFFAVPPPDKPVTIPINDLWTRETSVLTSYYCGPPDIVESMELLETGTIVVDDLITHRLPLNEIEKGFRLVMEGRESIKVIINPNR